MELTDLQNDTDLRNKFQNVDIHNFYQNYMTLEKFPRSGAYAKQIMTLFGSTNVCEQLFSAMKIIKSDHRSRLNDVRLESCVRVAVSSISANIDQLMAKKQCQISH
ncbi:General transcription factor II-I repeat domain-containing protein 2 [Anthophora plagiata]